MDRAKGSIDEHLDRDAGGGIESFHLRRRTGLGQLGFIEVAHVGIRLMRGCRIIVDEKRIPPVFNRARLGRLHFEPTHRLIPRVGPNITP